MKHSGLKNVSLSQFVADQPLRREVFLHLPANGKWIRLAHVGDTLRPELLARLQATGVKELFVSPAAEEAEAVAPITPETLFAPAAPPAAVPPTLTLVPKDAPIAAPAAEEARGNSPALEEAAPDSSRPAEAAPASSDFAPLAPPAEATAPPGAKPEASVTSATTPPPASEAEAQAQAQAQRAAPPPAPQIADEPSSAADAPADPAVAARPKKPEKAMGMLSVASAQEEETAVSPAPEKKAEKRGKLELVPPEETRVPGALSEPAPAPRSVGPTETAEPESFAFDSDEAKQEKRFSGQAEPEQVRRVGGRDSETEVERLVKGGPESSPAEETLTFAAEPALAPMPLDEIKREMFAIKASEELVTVARKLETARGPERKRLAADAILLQDGINDLRVGLEPTAEFQLRISADPTLGEEIATLASASLPGEAEAATREIDRKRERAERSKELALELMAEAPLAEPQTPRSPGTIRNLPFVAAHLATHLAHSLGYLHAPYLTDLALSAIYRFRPAAGAEAGPEPAAPFVRALLAGEVPDHDGPLRDAREILDFVEVYLARPGVDRSLKDFSAPIFHGALQEYTEKSGGATPGNEARWAQLVQKGPTIYAHSLCAKALASATKLSK